MIRPTKDRLNNLLSTVDRLTKERDFYKKQLDEIFDILRKDEELGISFYAVGDEYIRGNKISPPICSTCNR